MRKHTFSCETAHCRVCRELFMTGDIYWMPSLVPRLQAYTHVDDKCCCQRCKKLYERGYVALVEIDIERSSYTDSKCITEEDVVRLGPIIHIRRTDAARLFSMPEISTQGRYIAYVKEGLIDELRSRPNVHYRTEDDDDEDD